MSFAQVNHTAAPSTDDVPSSPSVDLSKMYPPAKNSLSHPININWIIPHEYLSFLSQYPLPPNVDLAELIDPTMDQDLVPNLQQTEILSQPMQRMGNLALSSCPGKKVRLSGPVRGRATINRDLDLDFARMRSFGISTIICCLDDNELEFLGASWLSYLSAATRHGMDVVRLPMVEGSSPETLEQMDAVLHKINCRVRQGHNVLTHCRGGVGRAGVVACCWLLNNGLCFNAGRAIQYVRLRRSPKAIETMRQVEYIIHYAQHIQRLSQSSQNGTPHSHSQPAIDEEVDFSSKTRLTPVYTDFTLTVPSMQDIINLERAMQRGSFISILPPSSAQDDQDRI